MRLRLPPGWGVGFTLLPCSRSGTSSPCRGFRRFFTVGATRWMARPACGVGPRQRVSPDLQSERAVAPGAVRLSVRCSVPGEVFSGCVFRCQQLCLIFFLSCVFNRLRHRCVVLDGFQTAPGWRDAMRPSMRWRNEGDCGMMHHGGARIAPWSHVRALFQRQPRSGHNGDG